MINTFFHFFIRWVINKNNLKPAQEHFVSVIYRKQTDKFIARCNETSD